MIDGSFDSTKSIRRLSEFQTSGFSSSGNSVSIVGLDRKPSYSTVMFTPTSASKGFSLLAGITVDPNTGVITMKSSDNMKKGVMIVAPKSTQLVLNGFTFTKVSWIKWKNFLFHRQLLIASLLAKNFQFFDTRFCISQLSYDVPQLNPIEFSQKNDSGISHLLTILCQKLKEIGRQRTEL